MSLTIQLGFVFILTMALTMYLIKKIIYIAYKKHLFDEPSEERKIHHSNIPNLGGVAIFGALLGVNALFIHPEAIAGFNRIFPAALILFSIGLIDDLVGMDPVKKFLGQMGAVLLVSTLPQYRLDNLWGLFGIHELSEAVSIALTTLFLLLTINAINLSDGINGLAGSITVGGTLFFSFVFLSAGSYGFLCLSVGLLAAITGFLFFNRTPARIFMGDTGAISVGFLLGIFSLQYLTLTSDKPSNVLLHRDYAPVYLCALLIVPFFDTLRVFTVRLSRGKSPFKADRCHVHHRLVDLNLSHGAAVGVLMCVTMGALGLAWIIQQLGMTVALCFIGVYGLLLDRALTNWSARRVWKSTRSNSKPLRKPAPKLRFIEPEKKEEENHWELRSIS